MDEYELNLNRRIHTPLIDGILKGDFHVVSQLLQAGSDLNEANDFGITPLMFAAGEGKEAIAELLIKSKADMNRQDMNGYSALMHACEENHHSVIRLLLNNGADMDLKDKDGKDVITQTISHLYHVKNEDSRSRIIYTIHILLNSLKNVYNKSFNVSNYIKEKFRHYNEYDSMIHSILTGMESYSPE